MSAKICGFTAEVAPVETGRTGFDSDGLTTVKTAPKNDCHHGIRYGNYTDYTLYRSCLPIYGITIIRSQSFLFLDDFEGNANISVAIKSCSTVG